MLRFPLPERPWSLGFNPDGRLLAVGLRRRVWLTDPYTGRPERVLTRGDEAGAVPAQSLSFAPDGLRLAVGHNGEVHIWSVSAGRWLCVLSETVRRPAFLPCGKRLVTIGGLSAPDEYAPRFYRLWFWVALTGNLQRDRLRFTRGPLLDPLAVSADDMLEVVQPDRVRRFDPATGNELDFTPLPAGQRAVGAVRDAGRWVLLAERQSLRWLGRRRYGFYAADGDGCRPVADLPARPEAWAAGGGLVVWADGTEVCTAGDRLDPRVGPVRAVAVAADGLRLAAAGDAAAAVWDAGG